MQDLLDIIEFMKILKLKFRLLSFGFKLLTNYFAIAL